MVRIVIRRELCVGAGLCVTTAATIFDQSEKDGLVILLSETPSEQALASATEAARLCPSQAIRII